MHEFLGVDHLKGSSPPSPWLDPRAAHHWGAPDEKMMFDNTNTNNLTLSREIQKLIDIKIRKTNLIEQIRNLMMQYFRGTWDSIFGSSFNEEKLFVNLDFT